MSDLLTIKLRQVGDGTNQECWCNRNSGHMVVMPNPYIGKHWLGGVLQEQRERDTKEERT